MVSNEPLELFVTRVKSEWLDYNGHLNAAYYSVACNGAIERFLEDMGVGTSLARAGVGTAFALESHVTYQRELREGEPIRITLQLLDYDEKRFHFFLRLFQADEGYLAATYEQVSIYVDLETRRSAPMPGSVVANLERLYEAHRRLPKPPEMGSVMRINRKISMT